ncbi:hypothetical protein OPQ81_011906 [Rhizoctonia solani]|nr:hypothetical protein OPQ81_002650 [Rhizoctonia solani]KAJ1300154.1 hypothetical protein OPQ81_011906 [Rhizoctonia solani]
MLTTSKHRTLFCPRGPAKPNPRTPHDRGKIDFDHASEVAILDLRSSEDYSHITLPNSSNLPFSCTQNPYAHPPIMVEFFKKIDAEIGLGAKNDLVNQLDRRLVPTLGCDRHVARLKMNVLRNRGLEVYCVKGGAEEWERLRLASFGIRN